MLCEKGSDTGVLRIPALPHCHTTILSYLLCGLVCLGAPLCGLAGPVTYDPELWTNGTSTAGWAGQGGVFITVTNPGTGGADGAGDGFLSGTFAPGGPGLEEDTFYTTGSSYTGNYQSIDLGIRFSFLASNALPTSALLTFHSTVSDTTWTLPFQDELTLGEWTRITSGLDYNEGAGWSGGAGAAQFWSDLASVDWVGVTVEQWMAGTAHEYGIDNWEYFVPEPEEWCLLAAGLISLSLLTRRRRINDHLSFSETG